MADSLPIPVARGRQVWTILFGLGSGLLLAAMVFAGGIGGGHLFGVSKAEGAWAMGVAFVWTPLGFIVGAIAGAVIANLR